MNQNQSGFSLVELLIVVMMILILSAIAIPNYTAARRAANQISAVSSLHNILLAEAGYFQYYNGFAPTLVSLGPPAAGQPPSSTAADLIDSLLAQGARSGYQFAYSAGAPDPNGGFHAFAVEATPEKPTTGVNVYYLDQSGTIRISTTGFATSTDSPI